MLQIRQNCFETNSSSTHSLVVSKYDRGYDYDLPVDENGVLVIPFGEFGWGPEILRTPLEKLSYIITDRSGWFYNDSNKSWDEILKELKYDDEIQEIIEIVKKNVPAVKEVTFEPADDFYPCGYVDHQSQGTSRDAATEDIIFNNSIIILIDNDNSCHFEDYYEGWDGEPAIKDKEELF